MELRRIRSGRDESEQQLTQRFCPMKKFLIVALLLFAGIMNSSSTVPVRSSFDMHVSIQPQPVVINGMTRLVYELHLTNFALQPLTLQCVTVLEASSHEEIMGVCDDALTQRIGLPSSEKRTIQPANHAVVYFEIEVAQQNKISGALKHRIQFKEAEESHVVESADISINKNPGLVLDPPVSGGPWIAVYGYSWERGHRRVFYAIDGQAHLPGRFAIDWIKLDEQGRYAKDDNDQVNNWYGYGADVIAVADASVAATRDNIQESKTISVHPKHKMEDASGNYIALDLGNKYFAFYEHLKPGSIRVKAGDRVRKGQVIGSLGFTGDSTGPHLHFHVADRNSLLAAEGVPYHFRNFKVIGSYDTLDELGKKRWNSIENAAQSQRSSEFPDSNVVVVFNSR